MRVLSADDACVVANLFVSNSLLTKSYQDKVVKGVVPIFGENESILMYAVNFTDGYILISATTDYYPILAIVEQGSFTILPESAQEYIIDELKTAVLLSKDNPARGAIPAWKEYKATPALIIRYKLIHLIFPEITIKIERICSS